MARRLERLEVVAQEAGPETIAMACDVTNAESCQSSIAEAARQLGAIDALVYTPAIGPLGSLWTPT
jgi:NADP-dependent 3-hydroxy acid dehydrogenase YdfG